MVGLRFGVLGPLVVWRGPAVVTMTSSKNRQVLGLLLLHANHHVDRDQIIDCAWGGGPLISLNVLAGHRFASEGCTDQSARSVQDTASVSGIFPTGGHLHRLEIRLQAIQLSPYRAGPPAHRP